MTSPFRPRKRAEELSARVDGSGPGARGTADPETERLVSVVRTLQAHGSHDRSAAPREAFARELRERLMEEARASLSSQDAALSSPATSRGKRERRLVALATVVALVGGGTGVAVASQDSLPGDTLYSIKRGIERVEVGLSGSPAGRGRDLLHQATGRLDEAEGLLAERSGTSTAQVPGTLEDFTSQSDEGARLLLGDYQDAGGPSSVLAVRRFAAAGLARLTALAATAPAETQASIRAAAQGLADLDRRASALCATCADLPDLRLPPPFRVSADAGRALARANAAKLDSSRPVLDEPAPAATGSASDVREGRTGGPSTKKTEAGSPGVAGNTQDTGDTGNTGNTGDTRDTVAIPGAPVPEPARGSAPASAPALVRPSAPARRSLPSLPAVPEVPVVRTPSRAPRVPAVPSGAANPLPSLPPPDSAAPRIKTPPTSQIPGGITGHITGQVGGRDPAAGLRQTLPPDPGGSVDLP
jgi:hypothetical protein